ncbi:WAP four-disulfide core domain protein 3 [Chanos chanos]|uniref:WAP four-disulfide core domain protein 3 n=1 Tax=Chanos chanos TaxID=29144 RepID=A0A6J2UT68_CHACN|nr:whey acidic protein-like [Chanos chanos]
MDSRVLSLSVLILITFFKWTDATPTTQRNSTDAKTLITTLLAVVCKFGHCPRRLMVVPSSRGCVCDSDCAGNHICCVFDCGAVCVPPAFTKPGVCPRRRHGSGMCAEFCSNDSDCPRDEKCCHNGCGHECTAPYTVKPGRCGLPKGTPVCAEFCYHDGQCPGEQKCCRTTCGHACNEPC